jgi:hypothetical protein
MEATEHIFEQFSGIIQTTDAMGLRLVYREWITLLAYLPR